MNTGRAILCLPTAADHLLQPHLLHEHLLHLQEHSRHHLTSELSQILDISGLELWTNAIGRTIGQPGSETIYVKPRKDY